jgi:hypothetical protein
MPGNPSIIALQHERSKRDCENAHARFACVRNGGRHRIGHGHGQPSMNDRAAQGIRHARMPVRTALLVSRGDDAWSCEILDISASGARVTRPPDWEGEADDVFQLDVVISETAALHMEARVARLSAEHVAFEFTFIPDSGQQLFWGLLGRYAEHAEAP